uniref:Uncharacterized protein n=1 Tax=Glossina pallidipes TaxID=7398 RepID=A0A1B0AEZ1_GLOPL
MKAHPKLYEEHMTAKHAITFNGIITFFLELTSQQMKSSFKTTTDTLTRSSAGSQIALPCNKNNRTTKLFLWLTLKIPYLKVHSISPEFTSHKLNIDLSSNPV